MKLFENKKSNLSTEQKVMKGYKAYCGAVIAGALIMCTAMPAFATTVTDPLTVVNNLSEFIFGLIPNGRHDRNDPTQKANDYNQDIHYIDNDVWENELHREPPGRKLSVPAMRLK